MATARRVGGAVFSERLASLAFSAFVNGFRVVPGIRRAVRPY